MSKRKIGLDGSWLKYLHAEFEQLYMQQLRDFLSEQKQQGKVIYPASNLIFNAFNTTAFEKVKVVILGQDPYHGEGNGKGQAHGLSFSVPKGMAVPPSLKNIYKEIQRDLQLPIPKNGCLQTWAEQGVLLLNATLSVERASAGSHQNQGWETFTDKVIDTLNTEREGLVFMLWGSYAQKKGRLINTKKHLVLTSSHPSPLSAYRGFLGCGHFSAANRYLIKRNEQPINWSV